MLHCGLRKLVASGSFDCAKEMPFLRAHLVSLLFQGWVPAFALNLATSLCLLNPEFSRQWDSSTVRAQRKMEKSLMAKLHHDMIDGLALLFPCSVWIKT